MGPDHSPAPWPAFPDFGVPRRSISRFHCLLGWDDSDVGCVRVLRGRSRDRPSISYYSRPSYFGLAIGTVSVCADGCSRFRLSTRHSTILVYSNLTTIHTTHLLTRATSLLY